MAIPILMLLMAIVGFIAGRASASKQPEHWRPRRPSWWVKRLLILL